MGLDMYAYATKANLSSDVDIKIRECDALQFYYWRKHPNLHGWMEELYREKGGTSADFNCVGVVLTHHDLDVLESDITQNRLPRTEGFFFGESLGDDEERVDDLKFIEKARKLQQNGYTIIYDSWW